MSDTYITHIGYAVPEQSLSQKQCIDDILTYTDLSKKQQIKYTKIFTGSGIEKRHVSINISDLLKEYRSTPVPISTRMQWYEQYASALGLKAIQNSQIPTETLKTITHIITVSCTGMYAPGIDIDIIKACQIPTHVERTNIYFMGCAAMMNALKTGSAICKSNPDAKILIVSIELCSLHYQTHEINDDKMVANALFADGAACVFLQSKPYSQINLKLKKFYSELLPNSTQHMAWTIRDYGFMMTLSAFIPLLLANGLKQLITPMINHYQLALSEIDYFAIHPGGPKILRKIEDILGIKPSDNEISYDILRNYGNMSSATILFILANLMRTFPKNNGQILSMAFGPGLAVESALLEVCNST